MEKLIDLKEAAELLGYSVLTMRNLTREGKIKSYRRTPKSAIRIKISDLEELMGSGSPLARKGR